MIKRNSRSTSGLAPRLTTVPFQSLYQPTLKCLAGLPTQLRGNFCIINRIAPVVPGAIANRLDQFFMVCVARMILIHQPADNPADFYIRVFIVTAYIVGFTNSAPAHYGIDGSTVIINKEPVANIAAIALERNGRLLLTGLYNSGNQFFPILIGAIII